MGLVLLIPAALHLLKKRVGASARYYGVLLGGLLLVLIILASAPFWDEAPTVGFALASLVCLFSPLLAGYSLQALSTASPIPWWISIPVLVLSAIGTLYVLMLLHMSRAGYIIG